MTSPEASCPIQFKVNDTSREIFSEQRTLIPDFFECEMLFDRLLDSVGKPESALKQKIFFSMDSYEEAVALFRGDELLAVRQNVTGGRRIIPNESFIDKRFIFFGVLSDGSNVRIGVDREVAFSDVATETLLRDLTVEDTQSVISYVVLVDGMTIAFDENSKECPLSDQQRMKVLSLPIFSIG